MAGKRGRVLSVRAPESLRVRLEALVGPRKFPSLGAAAMAALERGLADTTPPAPPDAKAPRRAKAERLERFVCRVSAAQVRRLRAHAAAKGFGSVSEAGAHLVARALEEEEGRLAVPAQKADELADAVRTLSSLLSEMGPGVLGVLHLLAHWAAKSGSLKVSEDELLAEVMAVGSERWQQVLDELAGEAAPPATTH